MLNNLSTKYHLLILSCVFYISSALKAEDGDYTVGGYGNDLMATAYMDTLVAGMHFIKDMSADDRDIIKDRTLSLVAKGGKSDFEASVVGEGDTVVYSGFALEYQLADLSGFKIDQFLGYYQAKRLSEQNSNELGFLVGFDTSYVTRKKYLFNMRHYYQGTIAGSFLQVKREELTSNFGNSDYKISTFGSNATVETGLMHHDDKRFFKTGLYYQIIYLHIEDIDDAVVKLNSEPFSGYVLGYEVYDELTVYQKGIFSTSINMKLELAHAAFDEVVFSGVYNTPLGSFDFMPTLGKLNETRYALRAGTSFFIKDITIDAYYLYSNAFQSSISDVGDKYHFVTAQISYDF